MIYFLGDAVEIMPIIAVPNQSASIVLDNELYDLVIKEANGVMACDITRNNVVLLTGSRIAAGTPLIPYLYLQTGNFIFITDNEEYPYYTEFNITQFLVFASAAELTNANFRFTDSDVNRRSEREAKHISRLVYKSHWHEVRERESKRM